MQGQEELRGCKAEEGGRAGVAMTDMGPVFQPLNPGLDYFQYASPFNFIFYRGHVASVS